ncbi:MAG: hypothetical protein FVQ84_17045 [Planctomycetes bacterium]|nr:hypothetical protein [Planctomycetota bacterium]
MDLDVQVELDIQDRIVEVHDANDGKYVAATEMHFLSKVEPGAHFVIRNNLGNITLRSSKDGTCDVKAIIRAKAETAAEARAMVEQVGMNVDSSKGRYYLKPVRQNGGQ